MTYERDASSSNESKWRGVRATKIARRAWIPALVGAALFALATAGCGGSSDAGSRHDDRFAAASNDEYTQPLTDAVIGTPAGIVRVNSDGVATPPTPLPIPPPPVDAGVASSGGSGMGGEDAGGSKGDDGGFVEDGGAEGGPSGGFGFWHFDDCSPTSNFLVDSSGFGANAQQALHAACVAGISNLGVEIRKAKDVIQVPDEPEFTVSSRVAVAAWVHPNTVTGNQPIVIKRLNDKTSFSLGIHGGNIEMSVVLDTGTTIVSQAPITAGTWTHVAGMFDGEFVFLFINGQQFGQVYAAGTLRDVFAPIRIGATTQTQFFDGVIDEVFVSTQNISKDTLAALSCISRPATVSVNPLTSGPVPFDTTVHYDIAVSDNDVGFCSQAQYEISVFGNDPGITTNVQPFFATASPGTTATFGADVTGSEDADPGVHTIPFNVFSFGQTFQSIRGQLTYELAQPTGCFVSTRRELMITSTSVVDDPTRTFGEGTPGSGGFDGGSVDFEGGVSGSSSGSTGSGGSSSGPLGSGGGPVPPPLVTSGGGIALEAGVAPLDGGSTADGGGVDLNSPSLGVWSFGHLMRELAPTPADAPAMVEKLFQNWLIDQSVNGFTVAARPAMQQVLLDIWPRTATGALDLDQSPLRLQAIVNRVDLRNIAAGSAGEGRFVFGVDGPGGFPQQFTLIFEYNLPASTPAEAAVWSNLWHSLSSHPFPSEEYNAALEVVTRRFSDRNSAPGAVNGSALINVRTNEIVLSNVGRWELREFGLSAATGFFQEATVKETPDLGFNGSQVFSDFVNQNAPAIIAEVPGAAGVVASQFEGAPFMAGSVFNDLVEWSAPGIQNDDARFHASLNTCNGCHGPEVNTRFLQITPRFAGSEATLSAFLTGTTVTDPAGQTRTVNDLARRRDDLTSLVCSGGDAGPSPVTDAGSPLPVADGGPVFVDASPAPGGDASLVRP